MKKSRAHTSLEDIARAAGVSRMTVSLALRMRPGPSPATTARVRRIAKKLGYRPNPLLSAYQAHIRSKRSYKIGAYLAWMNDHPERDFWSSRLWLRGYLDGAKERANELGYELQEMHCPPDQFPLQVRAKRLMRILAARGIQGIILPWLHSTDFAQIDWTNFAVSMIGRNVGYQDPFPAQPRLPCYHHANPDMYYNLKLAWMALRASGCRRIGLALDKLNDALTESQQRACFLIEQQRIPARERISPLVVDDFSTEAGREEFKAWFEANKPDGLMLYDLSVLKLLKKGSASRMPRVAELSLSPDMVGWSGIDTRHAEISSAAVDLVIGQLHRNERGKPPFVNEILVKGAWREPVLSPADDAG